MCELPSDGTDLILFQPEPSDIDMALKGAPSRLYHNQSHLSEIRYIEQDLEVVAKASKVVLVNRLEERLWH